ncbi:MAG: OsmC family protein [Saprospiraceae bacterium]|nr:OsmC family protein [Saprospiraceae bacterium]
MEKQHHYSISTQWTGNRGTGTSDYRAYDRSHSIQSKNKAPLECSSDAAFRGDPSKYNPEDLLVASISSCHMLWYLHLCADAGIIVTNYEDQAEGIMVETPNGGGHFKEVILNPIVTVTESEMIPKAEALHKKAHKLCFISNSVNFEVRLKVSIFTLPPTPLL